MPHLPKRTIHFGLAHVFPLEAFTKASFRELEESLEERSFQVLGTNWSEQYEGRLKCRTKPTAQIPGENNFVVKVTRVGEVQSGEKEPIFSLTLIVEQDGDATYLAQLYNIVLEAFASRFGAPGFLIAREATYRALLGPIDGQPGFQLIWESILKRSGNELKAFGPPIVGGGLRIVGTSTFQLSETVVEEAERDFKFESFLRDPRYLFVESVYRWRRAHNHYDIVDLQKSVELIVGQIKDEAKTAIDILC